jgi:four helix bundle protein
VTELPELLDRVKRFSLNSLKFYRRLPKAPDSQVPGVQYLRSSHAVWLNYRAARRGRSRAEFISKLGIVLEEIDECVGNLEYMRDGDVASEPALFVKAQELCAIFTKSLATAKKNAGRT